MATMTTTTRNRLAAGWLVSWGLLAAVFLLALLPASKNLPGLSSIGSLAYSTKNIEDVRAGDYVLAVDEEDPSRPAAAKQVVRTFQSQSDHLRILTIEGADGHAQELRTTNGHPFWVAGKGWLLAGELQPGDQLQQSDGRHATLTATRKQDTSEAVYNFEVADWHTYYVATHKMTAWMLVHNTSCDELPYRRPRHKDKLKDLAARAAQALAEPSIAIHGVSAFARDLGLNSSSALRSDVETHFKVHNTGKDPCHRTIELPQPLTKKAVNLFNSIFGR